LGTAFTPEQAREVRKVTSRALLCFDADAAGTEAALKSIDTLAAEGVSAWAVRIPDGKDPDEFVRRNGAEAFRALLDAPLSATQVKLDAEIDRRGNRTERGALARWAEETIRRLSPQQEWDRYRVYVAGRLGLDADDLRKSRLLLNPVHFAPRALDGRRFAAAAIEKPSFEREVLSIVLDEPALVAEYASRIRPERFEHEQLRRVWERMVEHGRSLTQPSDVFALFSGEEELANVVVAVSSVERLADSEARRAKLDRVVARLERDDAMRRYKALDAEITRLFEAGLDVPASLRAEQNALAATLKKG
jgi:DNA primase